jgi:hypothetical protein
MTESERDVDLAFIVFNEWQNEWQLKYHGEPGHSFGMPGFNSIHDPEDYERVVAILRSWGLNPLDYNGWTQEARKVTIPVQKHRGA